MVTVLRSALTVVLTVSLATAWAQKPRPAPAKPAPVKTSGFQKFTPPKLTSMLGIRTNMDSVFVEEAVQLVKLPLKVTDDKKNEYTISSYQLMYKRKGVTEDEATGKVTPVMSNISDIFRKTPLPELWVKTLTEQLRPGEELYFFDIVAKDAQGRLMFAPELKIRIK